MSSQSELFEELGRCDRGVEEALEALEAARALVASRERQLEALTALRDAARERVQRAQPDVGVKVGPDRTRLRRSDSEAQLGGGEAQFQLSPSQLELRPRTRSKAEPDEEARRASREAFARGTVVEEVRLAPLKEADDVAPLLVVAIDFETALSATAKREHNRPVQLGALVLFALGDDYGAAAVDHFSTYVLPEDDVAFDDVAVQYNGGLTRERLLALDAPNEEVALREFTAWLTARAAGAAVTLVAHNMNSFDRHLLAWWVHRAWPKGWRDWCATAGADLATADSMHAFAVYGCARGEPSKSGSGKASGSLASYYRGAFDAKIDKAHDGLADCVALGQVWHDAWARKGHKFASLREFVAKGLEASEPAVDVFAKILAEAGSAVEAVAPRAASPSAPQEDDPTRCRGLTKKNERCKLDGIAEHDYRYCRYHGRS
jgi:hypothetical protein